MKKFKINRDHFGWNDIEGDFVIYSTYTEQYHVLNETGKDLFDILRLANTPLTLDEILKKFCLQYKVDDVKIVREDILAFLENMCKIDVVMEI